MLNDDIVDVDSVMSEAGVWSNKLESWNRIKKKLAELTQQIATLKQQTHGAEPSEIISLCVGCVKEKCPERSEIRCCPVTVCAMRQG